MKALIKTEEINTFIINEVEKPTLENNQVLIKVNYCGVCGSDLHAANHAKGYEFVKMPIILGHEFFGEVIDAHETVKQKDLIGKKVVVEPGNYCNECEQCSKGNYNICANISIVGLHHDGAMAEYVKVNVNHLHEIPMSLPGEIAAMTEPLSVALHAVKDKSGVKKNDKVLVQGCGIIGFFTALVAKDLGADVTISGLKTDQDTRLNRASEFGINTEVVEQAKIEKNEFDIVFECSGASVAVSDGIQRLKKGGTFVLVALYEQDVVIPANIMVRGEVKLFSSYGYGADSFQISLEILEKYNEQLKSIIGVYDLENGTAAFKDSMEKRVLKSIIKINND